MEFALLELFNREDIITILNERQLHVQNINELSLDELLRVYRTFVMPLSRRPERSKRIKNQEMQIECSDSSSNAMDIDAVFEETSCTEHLVRTRMASPAGEKRRQRSSDEDVCDMFENDYQYQISSATKRIRINTLS